MIPIMYNILGVNVMNFPKDLDDYIIEHGSNIHGWYRKWKSGFIEQWGNSGPGNPDTVKLITSFTTNTYVVLALPTTGSANTSDCYVTNKTTTQFQLMQYAKKDEAHNWYAAGY